MSHFSCCTSWWRGRSDEEEDDGAGRRSSGQNDPRRTSGLRSPASATRETDSGKTFKLHELAAATQNFSLESFIGQGGFGPVYKGRIESQNLVVAIKKMDTSGVQGTREFCVEVLMLSLLRHPNLVNMIGYCAEADQRLLVYEYLPLGSLEDHLHDLFPNDPTLDWNTRMMIAAEAARGLNYLHHEANPSVIYRDLKTSNILLAEGFHAKLSDFGLAKFGPTGDVSHVSTRVMGTLGYCAPEYASSGRLTMKSDIYSFGVVLLELVTGRRALDEARGHEKYLVEWARPLIRDRRKIPRMADPRLRGQFSPTTLRMAVEIAAMCIREEPITRPDSKDLMDALEFLASRKYDPTDKPQRTAKTGGTQKGGGEDSTKETSSSREQAVAEAKQWGETWRERRPHNAQGTSADEGKGSGN